MKHSVILIVFLFSSILLLAQNPCKLPDKEGDDDRGIGFPKNPARVRSIGKVKVSVIFVDFNDVPAKSTPQEVLARVSPSSEKFLSAVSYGKLQLQFLPTFKWFRVSMPSTKAGWSGDDAMTLWSAYIEEALRLADPTVDFSGSDAFLIMAPPEAKALVNGPAFLTSPGGGFTVDGVELINGVTSGADLLDWDALWFAHEFGHTLTLDDLYEYGGDQYFFTGEFSNMGLIEGRGCELLGWERWVLGWLGDSQVVCMSADKTATVDLTPIEQPNGVKLLVIPTGPTKAIAVESRRPIGYDSKLPKSGVLVYSIDTSIKSGEGPIQVLPIERSDAEKVQNILAVNETLTYNGVTITVVASNDGGDQVKIARK